MNPKPDGGPAFPGFSYTEGYGNSRRSPDGQFWETWAGGMSIRDWFAGMALQGILQSAQYYHSDAKARLGDVDYAKDAFAIADSMIKEMGK